MKKFFFSLFFLLFISLGVIFGSYTRQSNNFVSSQSSLSEVIPQEVISEPIKLSIPKIGVNADIEFVGLDEKRRMAVPVEDRNVGWYKYGPKPGEKGSSVIAGHLDSPKGASVFFNLDNLEIGDEIIVIDKENKNRSFIVTEKVIYKDADFPLAKVFSLNDKPRLNLITCDGSYDKIARNYTDRLVIFTELKES